MRLPSPSEASIQPRTSLLKFARSLPNVAPRSPSSRARFRRNGLGDAPAASCTALIASPRQRRSLVKFFSGHLGFWGASFGEFWLGLLTIFLLFCSFILSFLTNRAARIRSPPMGARFLNIFLLYIFWQSKVYCPFSASGGKESNGLSPVRNS